MLLRGLCPLPGSLIHSWRFYAPAMPPPRELTQDIHAPIREEAGAGEVERRPGALGAGVQLPDKSPSLSL